MMSDPPHGSNDPSASAPQDMPQNMPHEGEARLLMTLERLLQLDATDLTGTLNAAAQLVGEAVSAEKVDLFLYHPENHTLQVAGLSATPMSRREVELGLDRIAIADGGRIAEVFETGVSFVTGHANRDPTAMRGLTEGLGVRSMVVVPLDIGEERQGIFQAASSLEDAFSEHDVRFFQAATSWVGLLLHSAELIERLTASVAEQARRLTCRLTRRLTPPAMALASRFDSRSPLPCRCHKPAQSGCFPRRACCLTNFVKFMLEIRHIS